MSTDAAMAPPEAPEAPASAYPSSWRGVRVHAKAAVDRWGMAEVVLMAWNCAMLVWLMAVILTFGDRADQSSPVQALGTVFAGWAAGTVVLFAVVALWPRRRKAVS